MNEFRENWKTIWDDISPENTIHAQLEDIRKRHGLKSIKDIIDFEGVGSVEIAKESNFFRVFGIKGQKSRVYGKIGENGNDVHGNMATDYNQSPLEMQRTTFHEDFHSFLTPFYYTPTNSSRFSSIAANSINNINRFRKTVAGYGYENIQSLRYLEERWSETSGLWRARNIQGGETSLWDAFNQGRRFAYDRKGYKLQKEVVDRQLLDIAYGSAFFVYGGYRFGEAIRDRK